MPAIFCNAAATGRCRQQLLCDVTLISVYPAQRLSCCSHLYRRFIILFLFFYGILALYGSSGWCIQGDASPLQIWQRNTVEFNDTVTGRTWVDDHTQIYECQLQFLECWRKIKLHCVELGHLYPPWQTLQNCTHQLNHIFNWTQKSQTFRKSKYYK